MSTPTRLEGKVSFGEFEVDLETAELRGPSRKAILPGKPFQILVTLLARPGQLVTREELKRRLWPSDTFVEFDIGLNKAVNRLRDALGDSAERPRYIETLPRKGYRFVGEVASRNGNADPGAAEPREMEVVRGSNEGTTRLEGRRQRSARAGWLYVAAVALPLLILSLLLILQRAERRGPSDLRNVRIAKATDTGGATGVAISPDGRYIGYSLRRRDDESLHLRQIATNSDVEIVPGGPGFHGLTFSPNGDYLYFVRSDPRQPYFKYLYSVPVLGGAVRKLIEDVDSPVTFSPDGRQLAFERAVVDRNVIELRGANADGSGEHLIATFRNGDAGLFQPGPSWSRDGSTIVCPFRILETERRWILADVSVSTGTVREMLSDAAPFGHPVWQSGDSLLMPRYDSAYERWQLWTVSYPDGRAWRFTNDLSDYDAPLDIAGDGRTAVALTSTVTANVWEAPVDDPSHGAQVTFGQLPLLSLAETADGHLLSTGWDGRVWEIHPNGQRAVFNDLSGVGWLQACGDAILFTSFESNAVTLNRLGRDSTRSVRLFGGDLSYPGCSPDGRFAYYVNRHRPQKLWRISTQGGPPEAIADGMGEGVAGSLVVSPDGSLLAVIFAESRPNAWKMAVIPARGAGTVRTFDVPGGVGRVRWSPAGDALRYLAVQNGATNIWEQAIAGGAPKQMTHYQSGMMFDFLWSSDNRRLLLSRGDVTSDVVVLSELQ